MQKVSENFLVRWALISISAFICVARMSHVEVTLVGEPCGWRPLCVKHSFEPLAKLTIDSE